MTAEPWRQPFDVTQAITVGDHLDDIEADLLHRAALARSRGEFADAAELFLAAADLATTSANRLHHLLRVVPCLTSINHHERASVIVAKVITEARIARDLPALVDALAMHVDYCVMTDAPAQAIRSLSEALFISDQLPHEPEMYQVVHNLAVTLSWYGLAEPALLHFDRALRLAEVDVDRQFCYSNMAVCYLVAASRSNDPADRERSLQSGLYVATAALDQVAMEEISTRAQALVHRALLHCMLGNYAAALVDAQQGRLVAESIGSREDLAVGLTAEVIARWHVHGDIDVLDDCARAHALSAEAHYEHFVEAIFDVEVEVLWSLNRFDDARVVLERRSARNLQLMMNEQATRWEHVVLGVDHLRVEELSESDPLTGLHNRRFLDHCIPEAIQADEPACIAVIDLDGFKQVNDVHGYVTGDLVLQELATVLERVCRRGDSVARLGGDEFVMVLRGTSVADARRVFDRVRQLIGARCWSALPRDVRLTASIGLTMASPNIEPQDLLNAATEAMRESKRNGRDRLTFR